MQCDAHINGSKSKSRANREILYKLLADGLRVKLPSKKPSIGGYKTKGDLKNNAYCCIGWSRENGLYLCSIPDKGPACG